MNSRWNLISLCCLANVCLQAAFLFVKILLYFLGKKKVIWLIEMTQQGFRSTNQKGNTLNLFYSNSKVTKMSFINKKSLFPHLSPSPLLPTTVLNFGSKTRLCLLLCSPVRAEPTLPNYFCSMCNDKSYCDRRIWPKALHLLYLSRWRWTLRI